MRAYIDIRVGALDIRAGWCWLVAAWRGRGFGTGFGRSSEETARVVARDVMRSYWEEEEEE